MGKFVRSEATVQGVSLLFVCKTWQRPIMLWSAEMKSIRK